jgi:hypothetical protein
MGGIFVSQHLLTVTCQPAKQHLLTELLYQSFGAALSAWKNDRLNKT